MAELERYIPGVPCWVDMSSPDPDAALAFYEGVFGWEFEDVMPPDAPGEYFIGAHSRRRRGRGRLAARGRTADGGLEHVRLGGQCR